MKKWSILIYYFIFIHNIILLLKLLITSYAQIKLKIFPLIIKKNPFNWN